MAKYWSNVRQEQIQKRTELEEQGLDFEDIVTSKYFFVAACTFKQIRFKNA
jgi:hypothetical protein